jgi:outer membrane protein assembly factor BamD
MSPEFSKDSNDIVVAIDKIQEFINTYPESSYTQNANNLVFELEFRLEQKDFYIALQYNRLSDFQAAIKSFENFLVDFPGSSLREKAMYYRFDSAYNLAIKSVKSKQQNRIIKTVSYYNSFRLNYDESEFLNEMDSKMSELEKIINN